jgi:hypothetical protein
MLIRCVESIIPVGCVCNVLISSALVLSSVLILVHSAFPSFHHLRSLGPSVLAILSNFH